jgi:hypothetical protein
MLVNMFITVPFCLSHIAKWKIRHRYICDDLKCKRIVSWQP